MFKMVPTHDYLTVSGVTLGFAHQNNDLLLKFQLRFSRISLASNSGCRTQCHSGDTTGTTTTFFFFYYQIQRTDCRFGLSVLRVPVQRE